MNRIAFVIPGIDRVGGAERQVLLLAKGLAALGWQVSVIALSGTGGEAASDLIRVAVSFVTLEMRKGLADPRGWIRFHHWLRQASPEILHAHLPHGRWMARISRMFAPVRVLLDTVHTPHTGGFSQRWTDRATCGIPDCITAVSQAVADAYLRAGLVRPERLTVVPNAVDTQEMRPGAEHRSRVRSELGLNGEFLWLAVGRLEPVKDYPTLFRALALLPLAHLAIAGSGKQERELRRLAGTLGLASRIHFLGFQPEIHRWMQAADAFVLSSLWEGLPVSLLEAGACGLPGVATATAGSRSILVDGETGFSASPGSVDTLRAAMARLMSLTPEGRRAMGLDARMRVTERFSLDAVLTRWEALYRDLLERNPAPRRCALRI
jgi:glycosyltransferase involved in cell wall biosynthesis